MKLPVTYIFTHDSIYVGEDGPTHQPIETVSCLRAIPGVQVLRPGDAEEANVAWEMAAYTKDHPVCLLFSRQNLVVYEKDDPDWKNTVKCGAYVVQKGADKPDVTIVATGSEVGMALEAAKLVEGKSIRVVSVMDRELFVSQPKALRDTILGNADRVIVAEAGIKMGWEGFVSDSKDLFCLNDFGVSGPANKVAEHMGFTAAKLAAVIKG